VTRRAGEIVCCTGSVRRDWRSHRRRHINLAGNRSRFPPPALESVVSRLISARSPSAPALEQLAEQITHFAAPAQRRGEISVRLYGEVQKEVVMETLARDYASTQPSDRARRFAIERPAARRARRVHGRQRNPFTRRLDSASNRPSLGSGIGYVRELGSLPLAFLNRAMKRLCTRHLARVVRLGVTDCSSRSPRQDLARS